MSTHSVHAALSRVCSVNMKYILVFVVLCAHVLAGVEGTNFTGDFYLYRDAMKFLESCGIKHLSLCLKVTHILLNFLKGIYLLPSTL